MAADKPVSRSVAQGPAACACVRVLEAPVNQKQYRRPESVLVLVYTEAGEVLLLLRRAPPDFWQSVTGALEWGEDPVSAAHRELLEETGLVAGGNLIDCDLQNEFTILPAWRDRYAPAVTTNTEHVFRVMYPRLRPEIRLDPAEHSAFCWLPRAEAWHLARSYTNRFAIERFVPA
jgi:dATP pyrophosphohydrolase